MEPTRSAKCCRLLPELRLSARRAARRASCQKSGRSGVLAELHARSSAAHNALHALTMLLYNTRSSFTLRGPKLSQSGAHGIFMQSRVNVCFYECKPASNVGCIRCLRTGIDILAISLHVEPFASALAMCRTCLQANIQRTWKTRISPLWHKHAASLRHTSQSRRNAEIIPERCSKNGISPTSASCHRGHAWLS